MTMQQEQVDVRLGINAKQNMKRTMFLRQFIRLVIGVNIHFEQEDIYMRLL